jgi:hypothetical protein
VRRRRKRDKAVDQASLATPPEDVTEHPQPEPALRILVIGQGGATREVLETILEDQSDMDVVGVFDDVNTGISGIQASTKRSGVVVLVDSAVMQLGGSLTQIRSLRDRFPSCRFLAYGESFHEDAVSSLLFFGADAVTSVAEGSAAVGRAIRRCAYPDRYPELDEEPPEHHSADPDAKSSAGDEAGSIAEPAVEMDVEPVVESVAEEEPTVTEADQTNPSSSGPPDTHVAVESLQEGPQPEPEPKVYRTAEEIWQGAPSEEHLEPSPRMTPEDVWRTDPQRG